MVTCYADNELLYTGREDTLERRRCRLVNHGWREVSSVGCGPNRLSVASGKPAFSTLTMFEHARSSGLLQHPELSHFLLVLCFMCVQHA